MTVVVFAAEKGGVGKTSLAIQFTALAAQAGIDTVLLDTDRQKSASNWLEARTQDPDLPSISILSNSADPLREIGSLSKRYTLVVVDIGAQNYRALVECAALADIYIIPSGTSAYDLDSAEDLFNLLSKTRGAKREAIFVALTKTPTHPQSKEVERSKERLKENGVQFLKNVIPARSVWRSVANTGRALNELRSRDREPKADAEFDALYREIERKLRKPGI